MDDGSIVTVGSDALDSAGYDLLALTIGSEGLLAVVLEVTVRLLPKPEEMRVVMAAFDDVTKAGDSVGGIIAAGIIPAGLEMMDGPAVAAVEDFVKAGYPLDAEALLLCEVDGTRDEVAEELIEEIEAGAAVVDICAEPAPTRVDDLTFDAAAGKICAADSSEYAGQRERSADINAEDFFVGVRTAQDLAMDHIRQHCIRTELRATGNLIQAIGAHRATTYLLIIHCFCHDSLLGTSTPKCSTQP